ncbi:MAG: SPOR domain-containing protein [Candidatus Omnitrophica bacterium]|nr:SPOR domain-containing protein [Candidatus Omnitrophota bacterium]
MRKFLIFVIIFSLAKTSFAETKAIQKYLVSKDYPAVISLAEKYLSKGGEAKDEVLFLLAEAYIGTSNLAKARETLRSLYKDFPGSPYAKKSVLRIADSYYLESNYQQARNIYNYFIEKYNDPVFLSSVYLKLAYCEEKLGNWELKKSYMKAIEEKFSASVEASKLEELNKRGFHFVVQVGAFIDKDNAGDLIKNLKKDGFSSYLVGEKEDGKLFYKVRIGKFIKRKEAEAELESLIAKGYPARIFP